MKDERRISAPSVMLLLVLFLSVSNAFADKSSRKTTTQAYRDVKCGVSFEYAAGWMVRKGDECGVIVTPENLETRLRGDDVDVWSITISVRTGKLLRTAADAGFDFVNGRWVMEGFDFMYGDAESFQKSPWWGLRGASDVREYHRTGGNAGFRRRVVIVAQSATVRTGDPRILVLEGFRQSQPVMEEILSTFRFHLPD